MEIEQEELIELLKRRLINGAKMEEYFAQQAAEFLIKSEMVTAETMFSVKRIPTEQRQYNK